MITFARLGLYGNIGNTLFQYSTLLSVGYECNYNVEIPKCSTYYKADYENYNYSIFDGFNIKSKIIENFDKIKFNYIESDFSYNSNIFNISDYTNIHGYFQSDKYFLRNHSRILEHLTFKPNVINEADSFFKRLQIDPLDITSVHVRRGDYLKKTQHHTLQSPDYFKKAINMINSKYYLFFSDDIEWCKKVFSKNKRVFFSDITNPFVDLLAMSRCYNNIIVNSSFSWWAAWLNLNKNKQVISPVDWFGPSNKELDTKDLIPESWSKI